MNFEVMNCPKCGGTGMVLKKTWVGANAFEAAYPITLEREPSEPLVVEVPCDEPTCSTKRKT